MESAKTAILSVQDLNVTFDDDKILENVNFEVQKGEVIAIVGPNGAGKSTLFRSLLGLVDYQGTVTWAPDTRIGYVPQSLPVEKDMPISVKEFLALRGKNHGAIEKALADVGLHKHLIDNALGTLSGGELQRVMIAWAIIGNPDVLLFDEPTAGIDIGGEETIYHLLHQLQDKHGLAILIISHDLNVVYQYANQVLCLNKKMICYGEPNAVLDPKGLAKLYGGQAKFFHHEHQ